VYSHNPLEIAGGIVGIAVLIFFPALYKKIDNAVISTVPYEEGSYVGTMLNVVNLTIGSLLLFFQCCNIVRYIVPDNVLKQNKFATLVLRGSGVRAEFGIKQAAQLKVDEMMENAYNLHKRTETDETVSQKDGSTRALALLNYTKITEKRESCGGFIWSWKQYLSGDLIEKEGKQSSIHYCRCSAGRCGFDSSF